ncbi:putative membrane protein [Streptomyces davaonensis JCM 4913]|uniref:Putative membrane protein n=1 Tax=Streptomyces davaonensis (strain DSM 101723 / JCM 4913 / KCC S-0913 / 768) TaxID=1214101 RepID=K4R831_STRDJ|nr:DUF6234 family protein [Streptomyces davaonensis]CCK32436.1 putative membrane protein [Streptomyces davaonensis JCM 4913]
MTTTPAPRAGRPHPAADVFLALALLVADGVAALVACLFGLDAAGYTLLGPDAGTSVSFTPFAIGLGVVGGLVVGTAWLAHRNRAPVTAALQLLAGLVLLLIAGLGQLQQYDEDHPPAPEPGYSGPQSQCLSGGDNSECHGS